MTALDIVRAKVANIVIDDTSVQLAVEEVEQAIKNYCNIDKVPEELRFVWANMSVDLIRYQYVTDTQGSEDAESVNVNEVSSIKIGDTDIKLGDSSSANERTRAIKSHRPDLDEIIMNNKQQLQKFRRMVW